MNSLRDQYDRDVAAGHINFDEAQAAGLASLDTLRAEILAAKKPGMLARLGLGAAPAHATGVYLYGPVGRGKTHIMNLFFDHLPPHIKKRRVHFHKFMIDVHDFLHRQRVDAGATGVDNILPKLASEIAQSCRVLCFDEFHVVDVADAMILQRLFTALFAAGIYVVMTSNWAPVDLYKNGLKREHFLPFIDLINKQMTVVTVNGGRDYRVERLNGRPVYFAPLNPTADAAADALFNDLTDGGDGAGAVTLNVKGRAVRIPSAAHGVARARFADLCEIPLGAEDYLAIAAAYHTLVLEHVPKLSYDRRNEAKRLMILIDALYEGHRRLIVTADAIPDKLYTDGEHAFEFERTISRLKEMQSAAYLQEV